MQKGMSSLLILVVTMIIVLVTGLTVISIFGTGMAQISGLTNQKTSCFVQAKSVCLTINNLPTGWDTVATAGDTCKSLTGCDKCSCILSGKISSEETVGNTKIREVRLYDV